MTKNEHIFHKYSLWIKSFNINSWNWKYFNSSLIYQTLISIYFPFGIVSIVFIRVNFIVRLVFIHVSEFISQKNNKIKIKILGATGEN